MSCWGDSNGRIVVVVVVVVIISCLACSNKACSGGDTGGGAVTIIVDVEVDKSSTHPRFQNEAAAFPQANRIVRESGSAKTNENYTN